MRKYWVRIHLFTAAFFAPIFLMMAVSGGLYLIGVKGEVNVTPVTGVKSSAIDLDASSLEDDVRLLLVSNGIDHEFEYLKINGNRLTTRPTSRDHYELVVLANEVTISRMEPDLQKSMIELHMGHGPLLFKDLQKVMAVGLVLVLISGLWLGLSAVNLRQATALTSGAGLAVFVIVALLI